MTLNEMIYKRSSARSYTDEPVDAALTEKINAFIVGAKPLYPEIKVHAEIVGRENIKCILPFIPPQAIAVFTEEVDGAYENVGFIFQQLDLYMQSMGLGVCWLGMGKLDKRGLSGVNVGDDMKFVMMLAFGHPKGEFLRTDLSQFKRLSLDEIADRADERLEPARLAPSSVNSQPWYFTHEGEVIHTYCDHKKLRSLFLKHMNLIDMGIALAHMYVANPDTFAFGREEKGDDTKGRRYIGSFTV